MKNTKTKEIETNQTAKTLLLPLVGLTLKDLNANQRKDYDMAVGMLLGLLDKDQKIKPLG
jgi:hypothetical protein